MAFMPRTEPKNYSCKFSSGGLSARLISPGGKTEACIHRSQSTSSRSNTCIFKSIDSLSPNRIRFSHCQRAERTMRVDCHCNRHHHRHLGKTADSRVEFSVSPAALEAELTAALLAARPTLRLTPLRGCRAPGREQPRVPSRWGPSILQGYPVAAE